MRIGWYELKLAHVTMRNLTEVGKSATAFYFLHDSDSHISSHPVAQRRTNDME
jgi:hypothetical protein